MALFLPCSRAAIEAVQAESHELTCRVFSGVMGHVPTDMGSPGLLGAVWRPSEPGASIDAEYSEHDTFEERFRRLLVLGASLSSRVTPSRVMVLNAQCAGGWDDCRVSVFLHGAVVLQREAHVDNAKDAYANAITEGAAMLGLKLDGGYFPPFERSAFEKLGRPCV